MGSIWLHEVDDWFREEGIPFREYPGWLTRSRSSGGFDQVWGVVMHHTASMNTWQNDVAYEWLNAATKPIGNMHLDRAGVFTLGCAGASNTNGRGITDWHTSKGIIPILPTTMGNRMAIAIEAANNGIGERWPRAQMDSYLRAVNLLCRKFGLQPSPDVNTHRGWAGTRKRDPFGPADGYPSLGVETWPVGAVRSAVAAVGGSTPPPPPPPTPTPTPTPPPTPTPDLPPLEGDDMVLLAWHNNGLWGSLNGGNSRRSLTATQGAELIKHGAYDGVTLRRLSDFNHASKCSTVEALTKAVGPNP